MTPVFLTGIPRSGIGIIARCLEICGANLGDKVGRGEVPENVMLRRGIVNPLLRAFETDPRGRAPFPIPDDIRQIPKAQ